RSFSTITTSTTVQRTTITPQPQPQPQPPTKDNCRGKRMAKRATVDLAEDDEEEEQTRQCARWTREKEILLT
ncbi:hypothetical protein Tco_0483241, partial [Tanacetum coccineum]